MYLPDVNVWVALAFPSHTHHRLSREWFNSKSSQDLCHFCRLTQMGFLRITNNPRAMAGAAVTQPQAWQLYDHFLAHPRIRFAAEPAGTDELWRQWANLQQFSPNLWNDAYLAAFAHAGGFEVVTIDRGFARYPKVRCTILA